MRIRVKNDEQDDNQAIEVSVGADGSVSLVALALAFPRVITLKYWDPETNDYEM